MNVSIVCPAYNEEQGVKKVLTELKNLKLKNPFTLKEIIVVDNNSTDTTSHIAKKMGARVIFEKKQGYGYAYKKGISSAVGDIIITLDADNTYPVNVINEMLCFLVNNQIDFLIANRFAGKIKNMPKINILGNRVLTLLYRILFKNDIKDSQSGMWVFYKKYWKDFKITSNQMAFSQEIKIEAIYYLKLRYASYPIMYNSRVGKTKLNVLKDGLSNFIYLVIKRWKR